MTGNFFFDLIIDLTVGNQMSFVKTLHTAASHIDVPIRQNQFGQLQDLIFR